MVEAISFKVLNETGIDAFGSDEVVARFESAGKTTFSGVYGSSDTGDTHQFRSQQRCIFPATDPDGQTNRAWACEQEGRPGPVSFTTTLYEFDGFVRVLGFPPEFGTGFCLSPPGDVNSSCEAEEIRDRSTAIGSGTASYTQAELDAAMPTAGSTMTGITRIGSSYDVTYLITRVANPTVAPPEVVREITLSASVNYATSPARVTLTWTRATTSTVDILYNGAFYRNTENDGTFSVGLGPRTYLFRVCNAGTTVCSSDVSVTVT
jgi:hypothetical protein